MASTVIWIAVAALLFIRQFQPHPARGNLLLFAPLILVFLGIRGLTDGGIAEIAFLAVNAAVAVGFGIWRGQSFRVWTQGSEIWMQGTLVTLGLWGVSIAVRIGLMATGHLLGISTANTMPELLILLGITFGAQNAVLWMRGTSRIPLPA